MNVFKMNKSSVATPAPPLSALRRSSIGAPTRRRASMQTSLHTISEHHHHGNSRMTCGNVKTDSDCDSDHSNTKRNYHRRRSSVSFSSETPEVKEFQADTTPNHFYTEREISQFREEAKFERQQFRRASTGSSAAMYYGYGVAPPPGSYPYIGRMARRGSNSSSDSEGSGGGRHSSAVMGNSATPGALPPTVPCLGPDTGAVPSAYVPMITFAAGSDQKKKAAGSWAVSGLTARMSQGLDLDGPSRAMPIPSGPVAPGIRRQSLSNVNISSGSGTSTQLSSSSSSSYQFTSSGGFSVPLDQVRQHLSSTSTSTDPMDHLKGTQFVSVSCPIPDRPSTARIA